MHWSELSFTSHLKGHNFSQLWNIMPPAGPTNTISISMQGVSHSRTGQAQTCSASLDCQHLDTWQYVQCCIGLNLFQVKLSLFFLVNAMWMLVHMWWKKKRVATACPWCYKKLKNECHCMVFFQTFTILIGRVTLILVYVCLALRVSTAENGERVVWLVISVCSASLLLDVLSAPHRDEWPCLF